MKVRFVQNYATPGQKFVKGQECHLPAPAARRLVEAKVVEEVADPAEGGANAAGPQQPSPGTPGEGRPAAQPAAPVAPVGNGGNTGHGRPPAARRKP